MDTAELQMHRFAGEPRTRGRAHGEALRLQIRELLARWGDGLERIYRVDRRRYLELFFAHTTYEATTARLAPAVLEEIRGIAEGSGAPYREVLAFQHVNEEFELAPLFAVEAPAGEACSTIVAPPTATRASLVAQNLDLAQYLDGFQTLVRVPCATGEGEIMMLTVPGMISLMGMNSHAFAICDNTLTQLRTDPAGLPIYALYRLLLECRSLAQARALIEATPHAVGLNWVMGDCAEVAMIERSGGASTQYGPRVGAPLAYHTNHPLMCTDWGAAFSTESPPAPSRSSYLRFAALHQRLQSATDISVEDAKQVLASRDDQDYPISRDGGRNQADMQIGFTLACSVFELRRGDPIWHLASGPPHRTAFRTFRFD